MKFSLESLETNFHFQKRKPINNTIEFALDNPEKALVSIWSRKQPDPIVKKYSLLAAFTALFIIAPLDIKDLHFELLKNEFSIQEIDHICNILSKKLQSRYPKVA